MTSTFNQQSISFLDYPFPGSSVYRRGDVLYTAIREVDPEASPPEIRTLNGETLFVSAEQRAAFLEVIGEKSL